ncbi:hypothetical protein FUA26_05895 [Seonamhaeicola algicola]|uniref:Uncharacterized protein n=1 Tax=Seonamhaeicola algicola TaxID=1719036 RepID=A0A5C7ASA1_9FLAO|nr:hypothetical protein [Seonamhaeicola algicola]TXE11598.1 hypothetical protein FUA26_05895 [Seonamhaeicola algicola]
MNCEQKSGVFLNMSCTNKFEETCSNCGKKVCKVHAYKIETQKSNIQIYCEDCYWENYLYSIEDRKLNNTKKDVFIETNHTPTIFSNTSSETKNPEGFEHGFGGGSFGGGGAQAEWTEAEMQSLNSTDDDTTNIAGILGDDDTFFYS